MDWVLIKTILRAFQLFCTLILTALIGNVIATNINAAGSATAAINFTMFVAVVCWLASIVGLAANFVSAVSQPIIQLPLDFLATLFTFIDAIVLAAKIKTPNCAFLDPNVWGGDYIAFGSLDDTKRCREIQASTAFMWFLFISFAASLFFSFRDYRSGGGGGFGGGSLRSSRPSMVQVGV